MRDLIRAFMCAGAMAILGLASATSALAAEPQILITRADPWVRPGLLYRATVRADEIDEGGPWFVSVALVAGQALLAVSEIPVQTRGQLAAGITVAMVPNGSGTQVPVLRVRISDAQHRLVARSQRELGDHQALYGRATLAVARLRASGETAALPWLLAEQASELLAPQLVATIADDQALRRIVEQLEAWSPVTEAGTAPVVAPVKIGTQLLAYRDPVDTSVQPVRVTVPAISAQPAIPAQPLKVAVVIRPQVAGLVTKSHWPPLPVSWLTAAATAGVTVVEVQAAGDGTASGAAVRRIPLALAAVRAAGVSGTAGAQLLTATDELAQPTAWRNPLMRVEVTASSALSVWATGPFVVVVGSDEHRSAKEDAETLAEQFVNAWAGHARGLPPRIRDVDWRAGDWRGHHLILIGSSRSNRLTRAWAKQLPLTWDDRQVTFAGQTAHRSLLPKIAAILPRPDEPACSLLILDGAPAWTDALGALPFANAGAATALFIPGQLSSRVSDAKVPLESAHDRP